MHFDDAILSAFFETAVSAVKKEDELLQQHCEGPCGYHHGVGWVPEPILMHLIFRSLIGKTPGYQIRAEQPYPGHPTTYADLVFYQGMEWVACVEAKWLESRPKLDSAKNDMQRMRGKLPGTIRKFMLGFWVHDPQYAAGLDPWLAELAGTPGTDRLWTGTFKTHWSQASGPPFSLIEIEAGLTLFEVK